MSCIARRTDRRVSVIIPTLQRSPRLSPLVEKLVAEPSVLEVIVLNNAEAPLHWDSDRVRVIHSAANLYVNPSWNLGASLAAGDILAIVNDDIDFDTTFLSYATRLLDRRRIGIVAPSEQAFDSPPSRWRARRTLSRGWGFGTLMVLRRGDYLPIPGGKVFYGDDWMFWSQRHPSVVVDGFAIQTEMSTTSADEAFQRLADDDLRWWSEDARPSIYGARGWHHWGTRLGRFRPVINRLRAWRGMLRKTPSGSSHAEKVRTAAVYFPSLSARGGAERLTLVMALELARAGVATTIFTTRAAPIEEIEGDLGESIRSISIEILPVPRSTPRFRAVRQLGVDAAEAAAIRAWQPDVFINCDYRSSLPGCGRINILYCHFPHAVGVGGGSPLRQTYLRVLEGVKRALVDRSRHGFLGTYDRIWANSRFTARHVEGMWARRAELVYPPCEMLVPLEKTRLIIAVGRFQAGRGKDVPHKSQEFLIEAFRHMTDLHADGWRLLLIGGASEGDEAFLASLRAQAAGLPVDFKANASRAEIADALGTASIFWHAQGVDGDAVAHPRSQEHFGISTVEAMSAGALPLVYGAAGPAEIVGAITALRPWQDIDQLRESTRRMVALTREERATLTALCVARAQAFDRAHFAERIRALLDLPTSGSEEDAESGVADPPRGTRPGLESQA